MKKIANVLAMTVVAMLCSAGQVRAEKLGLVPLDQSLLDSDQIFVARVADLVQEGALTVRVTFDQLVPVFPGSLPKEILLDVRRIRPLRLHRHGPELKLGGRYLFFLRQTTDELGDGFEPLPNAESMYAIEGGVVRCPGGEVFGLSINGLACGRREHNAFRPLTEAQLVHLLTLRRKAAIQRSEFARGNYGPNLVPPSVK